MLYFISFNFVPENSLKVKTFIFHYIFLKVSQDSGPAADDHVAKMIDRTSEEVCKKLFHGLDLSPPSLLKESHIKLNITGKIFLKKPIGGH